MFYLYFFFAITKLILKLWGEPHRNKKDWERITPSPSGSGPKGEGLPEGREAQKGPAADAGQGERRWGHWLQAHRRRARGLHTKPQSYLGSCFPFAFFSFCCMICMSSVWGTIAPSAQCFPLTELLCFFMFFWRRAPAAYLVSWWLQWLCSFAHYYISTSWTFFMLTTQIFLSHCHYTFDHRYYPSFSPEASSLSSVQSLSRVWLFATPWNAAHQPPCPSPTPGVYSNSCPLSQWCHPAISCSVIPFSFCLQSSPASGSFQVSHFFPSGGQSIGVSASTSIRPMSTQDWFPLGWTGWISLQSKGLSRLFSNTTVQKHQFFGAQLSL